MTLAFQCACLWCSCTPPGRQERPRRALDDTCFMAIVRILLCCNILQQNERSDPCQNCGPRWDQLTWSCSAYLFRLPVSVHRWLATGAPFAGKLLSGKRGMNTARLLPCITRRLACCKSRYTVNGACTSSTSCYNGPDRHAESRAPRPSSLVPLTIVGAFA